MGQGDQEARETEQPESDAVRELKEIKARSAAYQARPWHRKLLDSLDGFRSSNVLLFLDSIKPLLAFVGLILAVFAWTNWYFSPERRLLRLAERMDRPSAATLAADKALWEGLSPKGRVGSFVIAHCGHFECSASVHDGHTLQSGKTLWQQVEVHLEPVGGDMTRSTLLPAPIRWREKAWRWSVTVSPDGESRVELALHGDVPRGDDMAAFSRVTQAFGTEAVAANLLATARDMAAVIAEGNRP